MTVVSERVKFLWVTRFSYSYESATWNFLALFAHKIPEESRIWNIKEVTKSFSTGSTTNFLTKYRVSPLHPLPQLMKYQPCFLVVGHLQISTGLNKTQYSV